MGTHRYATPWTFSLRVGKALGCVCDKPTPWSGGWAVFKTAVAQLAWLPWTAGTWTRERPSAATATATSRRAAQRSAQRTCILLQDTSSAPAPASDLWRELCAPPHFTACCAPSLCRRLVLLRTAPWPESLHLQTAMHQQPASQPASRLHPSIPLSPSPFPSPRQAIASRV